MDWNETRYKTLDVELTLLKKAFNESMNNINSVSRDFQKVREEVADLRSKVTHLEEKGRRHWEELNKHCTNIKLLTDEYTLGANPSVPTWNIARKWIVFLHYTGPVHCGYI